MTKSGDRDCKAMVPALASSIWKPAKTAVNPPRARKLFTKRVVEFFDEMLLENRPVHFGKQDHTEEKE